jgi:predicted O-methyltransferase YrrM
MRMLEIGVRTGYVGVVFARAVPAGVYVGIDNNAYLRDGLDRAAASFKMLRKDLAAFESLLVEGDSSTASVRRSIVLNAPFDLIHVDGDHSFVGKLFDLEIAARVLVPDGFVLVDDVDHLTGVREATAAALWGGWFSGWAHVPTLRGLAVLTV